MEGHEGRVALVLRVGCGSVQPVLHDLQVMVAEDVPEEILCVCLDMGVVESVEAGSVHGDELLEP